MKFQTSKLLYVSLIDEKLYINSLDYIKERINSLNSSVKVEINKTSLDKCNKWFMTDEGFIKNESNAFFLISGIRKKLKSDIIEQPIIIQNEIGYLGIITKEINGNLYFLMQAKIEPGNINKIQISPTIQATRSNFLQKHGGKKPPYLDYFQNANKYETIVDQIQSEQSSRFYGKRNRNVIIKVEEDIEVLNTHFWLSLYQLKQLLKVDNIVNMDTRTVLSCIPYFRINLSEINNSNSFKNIYLTKSFFGDLDYNEINEVYYKINNFKMNYEAHTELVSLYNLKEWNVNEYEVISKNFKSFKVIFCDIEIEGREVNKWSQPLLEANGIATFALLYAKVGDRIKFLVRLNSEIGSFDMVELGPTMQREADEELTGNSIDSLIMKKITDNENLIYDVMLSEEGGRFYHEQNRNIIIEVDIHEINISIYEASEYIWVEYKTLNYLIMTNNIINIQLRNLLSLLEVKQ